MLSTANLGQVQSISIPFSEYPAAMRKSLLAIAGTMILGLVLFASYRAVTSLGQQASYITQPEHVRPTVGAFFDSSQGLAYYVAIDGDDGNPGTEASPFRTINRGAAVLDPGDILYIKSGTYEESLYDVIPSGLSWSSPVTLASYPGDVVTVIPNSGQQVIRFAHSKYVVVDGLILDGTNVELEVIEITSGAHHIRIQNSEIRGGPKTGIETNDFGPVPSDFNEFINLDVHHNGSTDFDHGLYITTSNNLIDNSRVHHNAGWGVHVYKSDCNDCANDNVVSNNVIYDNARTGERGRGIILSSGNGNIAYNNVIWGNEGGIQVAYGVSDSQVYNNVIYANDNYGIMNYGDSDGATIRNNIIYLNGGDALLDLGHGTSTDHNLIATNPLFVDASAHDFRLLPSSPAIDSGVALDAVPDDLAGTSRPQGDGFDIGAFEYVASGLTPTPEPMPPSPTATPSATNVVTATPISTATSPPAATQSPVPESTPSPTMRPSTPIPSPTATSTTAFESASGDLNGDGAVNVLDVQLCVNTYIGIETDPSIAAQSDINADGHVNVLDVQLVVNFMLAE